MRSARRGRGRARGGEHHGLAFPRQSTRLPGQRSTVPPGIDSIAHGALDRSQRINSIAHGALDRSQRINSIAQRALDRSPGNQLDCPESARPFPANQLDCPGNARPFPANQLDCPGNARRGAGAVRVVGAKNRDSSQHIVFSVIASSSGARVTSAVPVRSTSDTCPSRPIVTAQSLASGCATGGEHVTRATRSHRWSRSRPPRCARPAPSDDAEERQRAAEDREAQVDRVARPAEVAR